MKRIAIYCIALAILWLGLSQAQEVDITLMPANPEQRIAQNTMEGAPQQTLRISNLDTPFRIAGGSVTLIQFRPDPTSPGYVLYWSYTGLNMDTRIDIFYVTASGQRQPIAKNIRVDHGVNNPSLQRGVLAWAPPDALPSPLEIVIDQASQEIEYHEVSLGEVIRREEEPSLYAIYRPNSNQWC